MASLVGGSCQPGRRLFTYKGEGGGEQKGGSSIGVVPCKVAEEPKNMARPTHKNRMALVDTYFCEPTHHVVQVQDCQLHLCRLQQAGPVDVHLLMDAWATGSAWFDQGNV